ncbi:MAG: hypothetical protein HFJ47_04905 [Clostridia bacterium]|nr:hypothetical protein [Clostridia bacterium]
MKKITLDKLLCTLIIICPILDIVSFIFRNTFNTTISPSTILRPIISVVVIIWIFIKDKNRWRIFGVGCIYAIYAIIHIYLFNKIHTGSSYGGVIHEAQYLVNYSFMILNLFLYIYVFKQNNVDKLKKSLLISNTIYIVSIYISIITKTASTTYLEGMGYKGWFESGNSLSAILILSEFIILGMLRNFKPKWLIITTIWLVGIFLTTQIGTRVGLYGFILVLGIYIATEILYGIIKNKKINKKVILIGIGVLLAILILITIIGSSTITRRKHMQEESQTSYDKMQGETAHLTGDVIKIIQSIEEGTLEEGFLSEAERKSYIELYELANKYEFKSNDQRLHQIVYNLLLVKNQCNPALILFGNGYLNNHGELVLEMELLSFILNFGIFGFILYLVPFIAILIYSLAKMIKQIKETNQETIMLFLGTAFVYAISLLSGYVFFNSSSMMIVIVLHVCLINKLDKQEKNRTNIE